MFRIRLCSPPFRSAFFVILGKASPKDPLKAFKRVNPKDLTLNRTIEGKAGDHIFLSPPYNVTKEEIDTIVDVTGKVFDKVFDGLVVTQ